MCALPPTRSGPLSTAMLEWAFERVDGAACRLNQFVTFLPIFGVAWCGGWCGSRTPSSATPVSDPEQRNRTRTAPSAGPSRDPTVDDEMNLGILELSDNKSVQKATLLPGRLAHVRPVVVRHPCLCARHALCLRAPAVAIIIAELETPGSSGRGGEGGTAPKRYSLHLGPPTFAQAFARPFITPCPESDLAAQRSWFAAVADCCAACRHLPESPNTQPPVSSAKRLLDCVTLQLRLFSALPPALSPPSIQPLFPWL